MTRRILRDGWRFIRDDVGPGKFDTSLSEKILLPHTWNALDGQDGGNDYHRGRCWYQRRLKADCGESEKAWLEFEGANSVAEVYIDGKFFGSHEGGYSTFRIDVTGAVADGMEHELLVGVDNSARPDVYPLLADYTFMGGLYRDVSLLTSGDFRFDLDDYGSPGVHVTTVEVRSDLARLEVHAFLNLPGRRSVKPELRLRLEEADGGTVALNTIPLGERAGNTGIRVEVKSSMNVKEPRLWNGRRDPYLYTLQAGLYIGEQLQDERRIPVGIRTVAIDSGHGFLLNGHRLRLNGVSRHQDRLNLGWATGQEHDEQDMAILLESGANALRLAHYQHHGRFYDLCDRYGIVVWAEIPFITMLSESEPGAGNARSQLIELIRQNLNHPSIAFWGLQNEITAGGHDQDTEDAVRMLNSTAKALDPSRITVQAQVGHLPGRDSLNRATDAVGYNKYWGWYYGECRDFDRWIRKFHRKRPDIPLGFSEYGCDALPAWHNDQPAKGDYTEEYQCLYHEKVLNILNRYSFLWGTFVWNLFDFASDFRDEGGVKGMNNKGLVTHDRLIKKDAFHWYRSNWSEDEVLHIAGRRFVNRSAKRVDIKVYANRGRPKLRLNGRLCAPPADLYPLENPGRAWIFRNLPLRRGSNRIEAESEGLRDKVRIRRVSKNDSSYISPAGGSLLGPVADWFPGDVETDQGPMQFPPDRFSIRDRISKIIRIPEGREVLLSMMPDMYDHPMFGAAVAFSIEKIARMVPEYFPKSVLKKINKELNRVVKP